MGNGQGLKVEKNGSTFSSLNAMAAKIKKKFNGLCTLMKFVWYVLHNMLNHFVQVFVHFVAAFFWVAWLIYVGFFLVKTIWRFFCDILFNYFWKFSRLGNLAWAWDFWGFDFCPHSTIPVTWNPEYPPPPPTPTSTIWVDFEVRVCTAIPRSGGK